MSDEQVAADVRSLLSSLRSLAFNEQPSPVRPSDEGLRERKKRLMRQLISDTATAMFLERGFDEVRVAEVAAACDVSEKTVYNYFPTKESLILDREEAMADGHPPGARTGRRPGVSGRRRRRADRRRHAVSSMTTGERTEPARRPDDDPAFRRAGRTAPRDCGRPSAT